MARAPKKKAATKPAEGEKVNKHQNMRAKTHDELVDQLVTLKKEQFNLRFQRATQQLENPGRVRIVRREIAVIKTILGEKTRAAGAAAK
jgi:large subunit ribosomal protein L29